MDARRFIHLSDLHLGRSAQTNVVAAELFAMIAEMGIEHVIVSGDITDHGRASELELFWRIVEPVRDRLTVVPGNHDRLGDDLRSLIMPGRRVQVSEARGLYIVRVDSTGSHNRNLLASHGRLLPDDVDDVEEALEEASEGALRIVTLHHHPLPLPEDHFVERISSHFRLPFTEELELGWELVQAINGKCDLVLHGHRHTATAHSIETGSERPTWLFNAGSSTELGRGRVFTHRAGHCYGAPSWLGTLDALEGPRELWSEAVETTIDFVRSWF